jgi:Xaa-Pro aminopeptidase
MSTGSDALLGIDADELRRKRLVRLREAMDRYELDAIVAFEYANGRYAAGLRPLYAPNFLVRQAVVITTKSDDVICFVHQDDTPHRRKTMPWLPPENVREFPTGVMLERGGGEALAPIGKALLELGFTGGRIGTDIGTPSSLENLASVLPNCTIVDANPCLNTVRSVKFPEEIALLRIASSVVDAAFEVAVNAVQPGVRECDILAEVMRVFYQHNAEVPQCNLIVCTGDNTAPMQRFAGDTVVQPGDIVFMDIGACFNGMFSEATRTVACGAPNEEQKRIYRATHELHEALIGALRPGLDTTELQDITAEILGRTGLASNLQKMIIAHGIGVGYAEPPFISPPGRSTPKLVLEEGAVLAVVPTILVEGVPGGGGVRLEDVVTVTGTGVERLTRFPYDTALLN